MAGCARRLHAVRFGNVVPARGCSTVRACWRRARTTSGWLSGGEIPGDRVPWAGSLTEPVRCGISAGGWMLGGAGWGTLAMAAAGIGPALTLVFCLVFPLGL